MRRVGTWSVGLALALSGGAACSGTSNPLIEYPDLGTRPVDGEDSGPNVPTDGGTADADTTPKAKKLLDSQVNIDTVTSDGHLVFFDGPDLKVWPNGEAAPVLLQKDFDYGYDSHTVDGRFVAVWLGETSTPGPMTVWSKAGGFQSITTNVFRDGIAAKAGADQFVYEVRSGSILNQDIWTANAGGGAGNLVVGSVNRGAIEQQCRRSIDFGASDLVVGGCVGATTTPQVARYALNGSGVLNVILANSAPGLWIDHSRTKAVVQTATASSIHPLAGGSAVALDTRVLRAFFSADDSKVLYHRADGKVRRASTASPASPVDLVDYAIGGLDVSADARFVVAATAGSLQNAETDLVSADANNPGTPRVLATEKAYGVGFSKAGDQYAYVAERGVLGGKLYVVTLPSGAPVKLSDDASGVLSDGVAIYFEEYDSSTKTNTLRAARFSSPQTVLTIDQGLDPLTSFGVFAPGKLYVGSKLGLWEYPRLAP